MIEKWFEPFTLLVKAMATDGLGGTQTTFAADRAFSGVLTYAAGREITVAGQPMLRESPVLLHSLEQPLRPGDHVRRERDGAVYRVTDRSENLCAPSFSGLRFAQVPVERLVVPC